MLRAAALGGLGIAYGPADFSRDDFTDARLVQVLPDYELPRATICGLSGNAAALSQGESLQRFLGWLLRG